MSVSSLLRSPFPVLFLVGMRACGKTTLGVELARKLGWIFQDTDDLICAEAGADIARIVEREGWDGFRHREAQALRRAATPHTVVATGGGVVLRADNRAFMRQAGLCVWLEADAELLCRRLSADPQTAKRPPLTVQSSQPDRVPMPRDEVVAVLAERKELYRQAAHHRVDAALPAEQSTARIITLLCSRYGNGILRPHQS